MSTIRLTIYPSWRYSLHSLLCLYTLTVHHSAKGIVAMATWSEHDTKRSLSWNASKWLGQLLHYTEKSIKNKAPNCLLISQWRQFVEFVMLTHAGEMKGYMSFAFSQSGFPLTSYVICSNCRRTLLGDRDIHFIFIGSRQRGYENL